MAVSAPSVLLVEDTPELARLFACYLADEPIRLETALTGSQALAALHRPQPPAVAILDLMLPDIDGLTVLKRARAEGLPTTMVAVTAQGGIEIAVQAMRAGAYDFLVKPFTAERLKLSLRNALERHSPIDGAGHQGQKPARDRLFGLIGATPAMQTVYRLIEGAAPGCAPALITGESGSGKELCAVAIHVLGPRCDGPLVTVNCAAMADTPMERELFGQSAGAFPDTAGAREGALRRANGGTLFLDEVCDLSPPLQARLARFIQSGEVQPLGSNRSETVDVRLIAATNRDPRLEVAEGRFRADLYYRLQAIGIHMPPLSARRGDIPLLSRHLLAKVAATEGKAFERFTPEAAALLERADWPGNVRQLENTIRRAVILNQGRIVEAPMLKIEPSGAATYGVANSAAKTPPTAAATANGSGRALREVERQAIEAAIADCEGNVAQAARLLGISRSTLYRKLRSWQDAEQG
ncbi:MAG: sigma-54-dependent transcriptional regulator [Kiloniellales bacterium]